MFCNFSHTKDDGYVDGYCIPENGLLMLNVIQILSKRGFIEAVTEDVVQKIVEQPVKVYCGFDPTSDSLHLGNMVAIMGLAWFQKCGHEIYPLIGGATAMIGDPSGKSKERKLLDEDTLKKNQIGIESDLEKVLDTANSKFKTNMVNNYDWLKEFSAIAFLRDVGKFFRIGPMLGKESVRQRMASEEGLSYTEFSYQLLQAYDFLYLFKNYGVTVQIGGSDQWGNITAGMDLIRKVLGEKVYGVTFPLLTTSEGKKFGKTEKGTIWLSKEKVSPFHFYQYLIRVPDADVIKLFRLLTFLDLEEIREMENAMQKPSYIPNTAQKRLAEEITTIVHGKEGLQAAKRATDAAMPGSKGKIDRKFLEEVATEMPTCDFLLSELVGAKLIDILVEAKLLQTKGQARRLIRGGGVYINNQPISDENCLIQVQDLIDGRLVLLAVGKKNKILIRAK